MTGGTCYPTPPPRASAVLSTLTAQAFQSQGFPLSLLTPSWTSCSSLMTLQPALLAPTITPLAPGSLGWVRELSALLLQVGPISVGAFMA